ncbi:MAG: hypothetical protein R2941_24640 [Desulfobacterales bacterium]
MKGHHLVLGELEDFITGETLEDTLDERYRQKIARMLVNEKGYAKNGDSPPPPAFAEAGEKKSNLCLGLRVQINGRTGMIISRFAPVP